MNRLNAMFKTGNHFLLLIALLATACNQPNKQLAQASVNPNAIMPLRHAKGFKVEYFDGYKLISVVEKRDSAAHVMHTYVLPLQHNPNAVYPESSIVLPSKLTKTVCLSTNHVYALYLLGLTQTIKGISGVNLLFNDSIHTRIDKGVITNLGNQEPDFEKLAALQPDFIFTSGYYDGGDKLAAKLRALNILAILNLDYLEQDPLGRAEWIKFVAAFFDAEDLADSLFQSIESNYHEIRMLATKATTKPTVFCNLPYKEMWYMPSGDTYMATLIKDAGGDFLWKDVKASNGLNLTLDFEAVYVKAADADYWLNPGFARTRNDIAVADSRHARFKAFQSKQVFNNNKRITNNGGFDFWESGVLRPDLILADLLFIFHPELMTQHTLYYYKQLE